MAIEKDPIDAGFDPDRLTRVDEYLRGFVDDGRLPGWQLVITRHGAIVHEANAGHRDIEKAIPVAGNSLFRIYSMTKPITSVAAMILYERGAFQLGDPLSEVIAEFAEARVYTGGSDLRARRGIA